MIYIKQRGEHDCGVAALAMAVGADYETIYEACRDRIEDDRGINELLLHEWLYRHGWAWQQIFRVHQLGGVNVVRETWPPAPWAPVHLCQVLATRDWHFAAMDETGRVFDPWDSSRISLNDPVYRKVSWVMGLWHVQER